jgi:hypothetical protein
LLQVMSAAWMIVIDIIAFVRSRKTNSQNTSSGDADGHVTVLCINTISRSSGLDDSKYVIQVVADANALAAEVSAVALCALPLPSAASMPLAVIAASTQREGGGGGVVKVFLIPTSNDGGAGGLVCVRVYTGITSPPVKLLVKFV